MRLSRVVAVGLTAAVLMSLATVASAQPVRGEKVSFETEIVEDFCDVAGLTVEADTTGELRFMFNQHGPDGLGYLQVEHFRVTTVITNVANGNAVTGVETSMFKDLRVTDNGDGTLTVLNMGTGNFVLYGPEGKEGKAIARDPGQVRIEFPVDHGGTLSDRSDDEVLDPEDFVVVKESTGRNDDFCEAGVPILTG